MNPTARWFAGILLLSILVAGGFLLLRGGVYGLTIFVVAPLALGALASPANGKHAAGMGAISVAAALCALLMVGWEGLICIAMALPLAVPLGALGSWAVYRLASSRLARPSLAMLLLLRERSTAGVRGA